MGMYLSAKKLAQLQAATAVLLSPFSYESGDEWRRAACAAVEPVIDARGAVFGFSLQGERLLGGRPDAVVPMEPFMPPTGWLRDGYLKSLRAGRLGVIDWRDAYDPAFLKRTDFYHEVVRPNRLFAPLTLAADVPGTPLGAAIFHFFDSESAANDRAEQRKDILQLLVPAFQAGVTAYAAMRQQRETLKLFGEVSHVAMILFDFEGRILHQSRAFDRLVSSDADESRIRGEATRLAGNLSSSIASKNPLLHMQNPLGSRLTTRGGRYSLSAITFGDYFGISAIIGVIVEPVGVPPLDAERLAAEYHLTKRELQTAALLRRRLPTKEIAAALGVSVNTARRHTEHVLAKLGVHSRSELAERLSG